MSGLEVGRQSGLLGREEDGEELDVCDGGDHLHVVVGRHDLVQQLAHGPEGLLFFQTGLEKEVADEVETLAVADVEVVFGVVGKHPTHRLPLAVQHLVAAGAFEVHNDDLVESLHHLVETGVQTVVVAGVHGHVAHHIQQQQPDLLKIPFCGGVGGWGAR